MRKWLFATLILIILLPAVSTASAQGPCEGAPILENRLSTNDYGRVTLSGSANRVRAAPSTDADVLFSLGPGQVFYVKDFAVCTGEIAWLNIDFHGRSGWTAESAGGPDYFVEPLIGLRTLEAPLTVDLSAETMSFSPDGQTLYVTHGDSTVDAVNLPDGDVTTLEFDTEEPITGFAVDPFGSGYATLHEGAVTLWNLNLDQVKRFFPFLAQPANDVAISPDYAYVAFTGCRNPDDDICIEGELELFDTSTDEQIVFRQEEVELFDIDFVFRTDMGRSDSPIAPKIALALTSDQNVDVWRLDREIWYFGTSQTTIAAVHAFDMAPPELVIYGGCDTFEDGVCVQGKVDIYSWLSGGGRGVFTDFESAVTEIKLGNISSVNYRFYALAEGDRVIQVDYDPWYPDEQPFIRIFDDIPPKTMALSPDGLLLAIASDDEIRIYDVSVLEEIE